MSWMKKIGIGLTIGLFIISPFAIVLASKINSDTKNGIEIVGEGSSSTHPLVKAISRETDYSIQYTANGSGSGKESQTRDEITSSFGMMSSTKIPEAGKEVNNWIKHNIRTVTWAKDAISIVMNIPKDIKIINDDQPIISISELSKLYDNSTSTSTTWADLLQNEINSGSSLSKAPLPFGRAGGKSSSGTSDGFWHTLSKNMATGSIADLNHEKLPVNQQTPESNAQAFEIGKGVIGSISYISLGYAINNIKNSGMSMAIILDDVNPLPTPEKWVPTIENAKLGTYKWMRPFNVAFSINNKSGSDFVWYLLSNTIQKLIEKYGFISLTPEEVALQSDLSLDDGDMYTKHVSEVDKWVIDTSLNLCIGLKV